MMNLLSKLWHTHRLPWAFAAYFLAFAFYSWFSFSLTAPNLILSSWQPYLGFQLWMWQTFFNNRPVLTYIYLTALATLWLGYWLLLRALRTFPKTDAHRWQPIAAYCLLILPLFASVNALSYDVFNYIFNAKIVVAFQANPHLRVPLDFAHDNWTRFMHNTHTSAPYGYGWTALSLVPFGLGWFTLGEKFVPIWLLFRAFSFFSLLLLALTIFRQMAQDKTLLDRWWGFALLLNPLLLIETVSNFHNDLWMMVPALWSLLVLQQEGKLSIWRVGLSAVLLGASSTIKLASIVLIPLWLVLVLHKIVANRPIALGWIRNLFKWTHLHWADLAALLLLAPLLTPRSQQFHPWYLIWVLIWLPWMRWQPLCWSVLVLSASSLLRYLPYLWYGDFSGPTLLYQKAITWTPLVLFLGVYLALRLFSLVKHLATR